MRAPQTEKCLVNARDDCFSPVPKQGLVGGKEAWASAGQRDHQAEQTAAVDARQGFPASSGAVPVPRPQTSGLRQFGTGLSCVHVPRHGWGWRWGRREAGQTEVWVPRGAAGLSLPAQSTAPGPASL